MLKIGEVKIPEDGDFEFIKSFALETKDWSLEYEKNTVKVWTRRNELSSFNIIKAKADFNDLSSRVLYDVLHDSEYRSTWDDRMIEGHDICSVSINSDIGYYSAKSPKPFKNRDFVTQRCWLDYGDNRDKIIFNHSVNHVKYPPKKGIVRALSYLTSSYIVSNGKNSCTLYYITQSDPGGSLPAWIVNMASKVFAPKLMKKLYKASLKYDKWKVRVDLKKKNY
jgi:StAR-related lipid transfer protein 10